MRAGPQDDGRDPEGALGIDATGIAAQTLADQDQTLADHDQTLSDDDQTLADRDQAAADEDQAVAEGELGEGVDAGALEAGRHARAHTSALRARTAAERLAIAAQRDAVACERDLAAEQRDRIADERDRQARLSEAALDGHGADGEADGLAGAAMALRRRAAADRAHAAEHRRRAAADRRRAARDRERAAADRRALVEALAASEVDPLTDARNRGPGMLDLGLEIQRARRSGGRLVVVYADVVGLKAHNDLYGHAAGDVLLQLVARSIRRHLRAYDLVVRMGGDEFLCVLSGATLDDARARFAEIDAALQVEGAAIAAGFAALEPQETADELVARADAQINAGRRRDRPRTGYRRFW